MIVISSHPITFLNRLEIRPKYELKQLMAEYIYRRLLNNVDECVYSFIWQVYPTIQKKLNTLVTQYFDKKPHEKATFGFNNNSLNSEFQTKLLKMANVWSVSVFPPYCKVEHGDLLEENKSATFHVKLKDFQNLAPFKEKGLKKTNMDVVIKDPIGLFIIYM